MYTHLFFLFLFFRNRLYSWLACRVFTLGLFWFGFLVQVYQSVGSVCPDVDCTSDLVALFNLVQSNRNVILAGHDVSDGGLIVALLEMAFAGNVGFDVKLTNTASSLSVSHLTECLFAEELGAVLQVRKSDVTALLRSAGGLAIEQIGCVRADGRVTLKVNDMQELLLDADVCNLRDIWEGTSFALERLQCNPTCVDEEQATLRHRTTPQWNIWPVKEPCCVPPDRSVPRVAVIREEGSNGDREMAAAFMKAGFEVFDVNSHDLCSGIVSLDDFRGLAFVGGFSYADVLGSARGWAASLLYNSRARAQLDAFRARSDTFSLGICNGCQLLALLGWVGSDNTTDEGHPANVVETGSVQFTHNISGRYESRFVNVRIVDSPAIMLAGMAGHSAGVWVAHGEGRLECSDATRKRLVRDNLAPVRFVSDNNLDTEVYPYNPNGSPLGITGLCSANGRHLAMMPHPERTINKWSWPFPPGEGHKAWQQMFNNAFNWCCEH